MNVKIKVSPIFDPWYYEFYLKGLTDYYGKENVSFDYTKPFMHLAKYFETKYKKDFFYYEIHEGNQVKKVSISAEDWCDLNPEIYEQVDCYAKVNVDAENLKGNVKLLPIGPNFGIRHFTSLGYFIFSLKMFLKTGVKNPYIKTYLKLSIKRSYFKSYEVKEKFRNKFVFYLNYPWSKHKSVTELRISIIKKLQKLNEEKKINFEGGFSKRRRGFHKTFEKYSATKIYNHALYLEKLKQSAVAINTPAVHDCLGWKLGEYLALGKPILSLPIHRILPGDFVAGKHYHQFNDVETNFEKELLSLIENEAYSNELAQNAAAYFADYLAPKSVIEKIHQQVSSK